MSRRKYTIRRDEGRHLTDRQREILGRAWNQYVNRLVRRWYPKGTDFSTLSRRQVRQFEDTINTIHRESLP